jgi:hypothetical protein
MSEVHPALATRSGVGGRFSGAEGRCAPWAGRRSMTSRLPPVRGHGDLGSRRPSLGFREGSFRGGAGVPEVPDVT